MEVTKKTGLNWTNWLSETATDKNVMQHVLWIFPAPFTAIHYAGEKNYSPGNEASDSGVLKKERNSNVELYRTESSSGIKASGHVNY